MSAADGGGQVRLLLWDAPDMELRLHDVLGQRPRTSQRPDLGKILAWLEDRCQPGERVEAVVFTSMNPGHEKAVVRWVVDLRNSGLRVFVKPRSGANDDIDSDMGEYLSAHLNQGKLIEVFLASHERKAFVPALERSHRAGIDTCVLGFWELEDISPDTGLRVMDIRDVPGAFEESIPRTDLRNLPSSGRWFEPLHSLRSESAEAWATRDDEFAEFDSRAETTAETLTVADYHVTEAPTSDRTELEAAVPVLGQDDQYSLLNPTPADDSGEGGNERTGPSRDQVLRYVAGRVDAALDDGEEGLNDTVINRKLKMRFRGLDLEQLGFGSVSGVMLAVAAKGPFSLIEVADGRRMLIAGPTRSQVSPDAGALDSRDHHSTTPLPRTTSMSDSADGLASPTPATSETWFSGPGVVTSGADHENKDASAALAAALDSEDQAAGNLPKSDQDDRSRPAPPWPDLPSPG